MNQYRCETCKHYHDETKDQYGMCYAESAHREAMYNNTYDHVVKYGCASHSDFQSERDRLLDELITHYKKVIEDGKGVTYNHPINYQWMYGGVVKYLEELRQAGEP